MPLHHGRRLGLGVGVRGGGVVDDRVPDAVGVLGAAVAAGVDPPEGLVGAPRRPRDDGGLGDGGAGPCRGGARRLLRRVAVDGVHLQAGQVALGDPDLDLLGTRPEPDGPGGGLAPVLAGPDVGPLDGIAVDLDPRAGLVAVTGPDLDRARRPPCPLEPDQLGLDAGLHLAGETRPDHRFGQRLGLGLDVGHRGRTLRGQHQAGRDEAEAGGEGGCPGQPAAQGRGGSESHQV